MRLAIQLSTLIVGAIALAAPTVSAKPKKHAMHLRHHRPVAGPRTTAPWTAPPPRAGNACPGMARSFDCGTWPPPFDEDPDRKATSSDGG